VLALVALAAPLALPVPSFAGWSHASGSLEFVVERIRNTGPASFRLDIYVEPGDVPGFVGDMATQLDGRGHPVVVEPGIMTVLNEHREPTAYARQNTVTTCSAGQCRTGRTALAAFTALADDEGPTTTPTEVVVVQAESIKWTFTTHGYRLRRVTPRFRYLTGSRTDSVGVDYIGTGTEAFLGGASLPGGPRGSLVAATAPCSTSRTSIRARGAGRVSLTGGRTNPIETCPVDDGRLADGAAAATTWRLDGPVVGDNDFRGVRLFVVDLPLR
jgi:hypothetical protein